VTLWGLGFSLPGFAHNTRNEYSQMLNLEDQDGISMFVYHITRPEDQISEDSSNRLFLFFL
jgi:hypothetical protein